MYDLSEKNDYTLLEKLEHIDSKILDARSELGKISVRNPPKIAFYGGEILASAARGMGHAPSKSQIANASILEQYFNQPRRNDSGDEVNANVKIMKEQEKQRIETIEDYASRFSIVKDAIHSKFPFTKYIDAMVTAADEKIATYKFLGKFDPQEFLVAFPGFNDFKDLIDTRWEINSMIGEELNNEPQYVKGKYLENVSIPALGFLGAAGLSALIQNYIPVILYSGVWTMGHYSNKNERNEDKTFQSTWDIIKHPVNKFHRQAVKLERELSLYEYYKTEYKRYNN